MPRETTTDWNAADRAPEYPPGAGEKVSTETRPVTETAIEARQGVTGQGGRYVLFLSTAAIVIAFIVIYAAFLS